jgi:MYXO-CTERM domain-containing protein
MMFFFGVGPSLLGPVLTLDGSFADIIAADSNLVVDGFFFAVGSAAAAEYGLEIYVGAISFGDNLFLFSPADYSLTPQSAVPIPATLALVASGLGLAGAIRRRA